jgi:uncharacterized protein (TIGR00251 family)
VQRPDGVCLKVKVVPGASRNRIAGVLGDALKLSVSEPAQKGQANAAVVALLATLLKLPRDSVSIVRGRSNPRKEVLVRGLTLEQLSQKLAAVLTPQT